jgi:carbon-monoxide dehydrogenase medium subunit
VYQFNYVKAKSLKEAGELLAQNPDAKLLAGGMTLLPTLKARLAQPTHLIDIGNIAGIKKINLKIKKLVIGAGVPHHAVATSDEVKQAIPALARLAGMIGDPQVRNRGTIGGSVSNNDPAADYPAAVLALNAKVVTAKRRIKADDFFQGMFATALEPGEIVKSIEFPLPLRAAYAKFAHPASGYAMTGVFVAQVGKSVRVAVTGAGPGVYRWSAAERALKKNMSPAALDKLKVDATDLNEDLHASREYRANLVKVMAQRAVAQLAGQ